MREDTADPRSLLPTGEHGRIAAIDAIRGLALLGIFAVNIQSFSEPFAEFLLPRPVEGSSTTPAPSES